MFIPRALSFREALRKAGFKDDEPRDKDGKWTSGGGSSRRGKGSKKPRGRETDQQVLERLRRQHRTAMRRPIANSKEQREQMAIDYARWLAHRDGIELPPLKHEGGEHAVANEDQRPKVDWSGVSLENRKWEARVRSVYFPGFTEREYVEPPRPKNWSRLTAEQKQFARMGQWVEHETPGVRIKIPNWDHVPIVTRSLKKFYASLYEDI